ncbi:hypothetical protein HZF24_04465 [Sedimentibacter hydroxybenzoicus DSM 7310]|uniref:Uncharacterized protein n=1 Tax=Sedimentibacter hydroxybenzoicus DSM 7310 TaxID=1123245 RepID=A0A974GVI8_SEDHY|nr:hypothetical protein [Sedimentibacter hydroxybenzoicus]NYB73389.1 hypothetical protein [Sedimentibacter hydroxybenzoicus DSM 7310]
MEDYHAKIQTKRKKYNNHVFGQARPGRYAYTFCEFFQGLTSGGRSERRKRKEGAGSAEATIDKCKIALIEIRDKSTIHLKK